MASTTRQALLQALSAAEGAYISGQQLAQQLGVSRAAVHKAAAALTAQGYALEAASRRGYRLLGGDPFCTEAVGPYPAPVQLYDTLESTNRTAKLLALEGIAHGTLVLAGCTARWCCARRCLPPTLRPPPSARQWQCAGRCRRCAGWNLPSSG